MTRGFLFFCAVVSLSIDQKLPGSLTFFFFFCHSAVSNPCVFVYFTVFIFYLVSKGCYYFSEANC